MINIPSSLKAFTTAKQGFETIKNSQTQNIKSNLESMPKQY